MNQKTLMEDVDYIKTLAQEGADTPLVGGRIGLMWGVLLTATFGMQWAILSQTLAIAPSYIWLLWLVFAITGGIGCAILSQGVAQKPGSNSAANKVEAYVWTYFSFMMMALFLGIVLNMFFNGGTNQLFNLMVIVAFAGQGLAYGVIAKMSGLKWMRNTSLLCFATSTLCFTLYNSHDLYLVAALGAIMTIVIPSLISMKNEPSDVV